MSSFNNGSCDQVDEATQQRLALIQPFVTWASANRSELLEKPLERLDFIRFSSDKLKKKAQLGDIGLQEIVDDIIELRQRSKKREPCADSRVTRRSKPARSRTSANSVVVDFKRRAAGDFD